MDASRSVLGAVTWAAGAADRLRLPLHLVHVLPPAGLGYRRGVPHGRAKALLQRATRVATSVAPRVPVTRLTVNARVGSGLACYSAGARLLVVGSRPGGVPVARSGGRVLAEVTTLARCPTVVVPVGWAAVRRCKLSTRPVLVGVDGSVAGERALAFGAQTADPLGVSLVPVTAAGLANSSRTIAGGEGQDGLRPGLIARRLAAYRQHYPSLRIENAVEVGNPATTLLDLGRRAQLIVVGSRGRIGAAGPHLGPASQTMLRAGWCPVMVISPRTRYLAEPRPTAPRGVSTRSRTERDSMPVDAGVPAA
ncbi:MAG: universal stress protein [Thermocrispum sp.]